LVAALVLLGLTGPLAHGGETWRVAAADSRISLEREPDSPWPAAVGWFEVFPQGLPATGVTVQVFADHGAPVACEILWARDGEPLKLLFDCSSGAARYTAYLSPSSAGIDSPAQTGLAKAGLVLETRPYPVDGKAWTDPRAAWEEAGPPYGRSVVAEIHHGIHPHGPTTRFMACFTGGLTIPEEGDYAFATVSDDASFLLIDGRRVAEWPGIHPVAGGRLGQYGGRLHLAAGHHTLVYYNMQEDAGFSVTAAWRPPGASGFSVIPASAFAPLARFRVTDHVPHPARADEPRFRWRLTDHAMAYDRALVNAAFEVWRPEPETRYVWTFDDGAGAEGPAVRHTFPRPGLRAVRLEAIPGRQGGQAVRLDASIRVTPVWTQRVDWVDAVAAKQRRDILGRDLSKMPMPDLAYLAALTLKLEARDWATPLGMAVLDRQAALGAEDAPLAFDLAMHFQHPDVRLYEAAERAFRAAIQAAPEGTPGRQKAQLHLAGFLIHGRERTSDARALLERLDAAVLDPTDSRLKTLYLGDAFLSDGHVRAARDAYAAAGTTVSKDDAAYAVRRRMRLETAKSYLQMGEYDEAEKRIREIEWETPMERLNTETGLVLIRVHLGRKEYPFALSHAHRLLNAAPLDSRNPEVLFCLAETAFAMGATNRARQALAVLREKHPYSEATALATDRWKD